MENKTPEIVQVPTEELGGEQETTGSEAVPVENEKPETKEEEKKEEKAEGGKQELSGGITDELKVFVGLADGVFAFADAPGWEVQDVVWYAGWSGCIFM